MTDKTKVSNYFIRKSIADRLKAGDKVPSEEIELFQYKDLNDSNRGWNARNNPDALIACDLLIGETW